VNVHKAIRNLTTIHDAVLTKMISEASAERKAASKRLSILLAERQRRATTVKRFDPPKEQP
jgi:6-phosphogluconate dehydrogenase